MAVLCASLCVTGVLIVGWVTVGLCMVLVGGAGVILGVVGVVGVGVVILGVVGGVGVGVVGVAGVGVIGCVVGIVLGVGALGFALLSGLWKYATSGLKCGSAVLSKSCRAM